MIKLEQYPDLKIIKKKYGEDFALFCYKEFQVLLNHQGLLSQIIQENFAPSRFLYQDIINQDKVINFKNYVFCMANLEQHVIKNDNIEHPKVLMDKAGYELFKCETQDDVNSFMKYYADGEEICTFWDPDRIKENLIFFAVRKDVDKIKRAKNPSITDPYAKSVISIQFRKGLSSCPNIINRYNHSVRTPNAAFEGNLENIIEGLSDSFQKHYKVVLGIDANMAFSLNKYIKADDGRYYRYNNSYRPYYATFEEYYCTNNVVIENGNVVKYDKNRYIVFDEFILDKSEKKFVNSSFDDAFVKEFYEETDMGKISTIEKIETLNLKNDEKLIKIWCKNKTQPAEIKLNKYNQIYGYSNPNSIEIGDYFLFYNKTLTELNLPNVRTIGDGFLRNNQCLSKLDLPCVSEIGNGFLFNNQSLKSVKVPKVKNWGMQINPKVANYIKRICKTHSECLE